MERETGIEPATSSLGIVLEMLWLLSLEDLHCATTRKSTQKNALSAPYPHPENFLAGSSNTVNLTEYTGFGLLGLIEIPPKLKIHPETR